MPRPSPRLRLSQRPLSLASALIAVAALFRFKVGVISWFAACAAAGFALAVTRPH